MTGVPEATDPVTDEVVHHRLPTARWWLVFGLVVAVAVSFQQMTQPDYNTHRRPPASEWLWVAVPGLVVSAVLVWRILRSRVDTDPSGVSVVRALSTERLAWDQVAGLEVRPTPNRGGFVVVARHRNLRTTKLGTIPGRSDKRRAQAEAFAAGLEQERERWAGAASVAA